MNLELKAQIVRRYGNQANFAQAIKKDDSFVSRVIRGRKPLEPEEQERWAMALGKKTEELFAD